MNIGRMIINLCPVGLIGPVARLAGPRIQEKARERSDALLAEQRAQDPDVPSKEMGVAELSTFLRSWGVPYIQVAGGSIPETDLTAIWNMIEKRCDPPIIGVHVGNFVGVSLAYMATRLRTMDERNVVCSIDPNLTCRGIEETEKLVTRLLRTLDVQDTVLRLNGYSLGKSMSNDGYTFAGYDPVKHYLEEEAPERQLANLTKVVAGKVDFVMLDGHHEADYLREEVGVCHDLLRSGGVLFLDDISDTWVSLQQEFEELRKTTGFDSDFIGTRTGVLIKK